MATTGVHIPILSTHREEEINGYVRDVIQAIPADTARSIEDCAQSLSNLLEINPGLRNILLKNMDPPLLPHHIIILAEALSVLKSPVITGVDLTGTRLDNPENLAAVRQLIKKAPHLEHLTLDFTDLNLEGIIELLTEIADSAAPRIKTFKCCNAQFKGLDSAKVDNLKEYIHRSKVFTFETSGTIFSNEFQEAADTNKRMAEQAARPALIPPMAPAYSEIQANGRGTFSVAATPQEASAPRRKWCCWK